MSSNRSSYLVLQCCVYAGSCARHYVYIFLSFRISIRITLLQDVVRAMQKMHLMLNLMHREKLNLIFSAIIQENKSGHLLYFRTELHYSLVVVFALNI